MVRLLSGGSDASACTAAAVSDALATGWAVEPRYTLRYRRIRRFNEVQEWLKMSVKGF